MMKKVICILVGFSTFLCSVEAQETESAATPLSILLDDTFETVPLLGFNCETRVAPEWSDVSQLSSFTDSTAALKPRLLRYPGGNVSAYWNWEAGWVMSASEIYQALRERGYVFNFPSINSADWIALHIDLDESNTLNSEVEFLAVIDYLISEPRSGLSVFWTQMYLFFFQNEQHGIHDNTPQSFTKVLDASGAEPILVLNMLTSTVEDQIAMIDAFENQGAPVNYVELGSEYNHSNHELYNHVFQKIAADGSPLYNYADTCWQWMAEIWEQYPDMEIGLVSGDKEDLLDWNRVLQNKIINKDEWEDPTSVFYNKQDQLNFIMHYYTFTKILDEKIDENQILGMDAIIDEIGLPALFGYPEWRVRCYFNEWENYDLFIDQEMDVWVTEYNLFEQRSESAEISGEWLHGLYIAQLNKVFIDMNLESEGGNIDMLLYHNIGSKTSERFNALNVGSDNTDTYQVTAPGLMLRLWNRFFEGMSELKKINLFDELGEAPEWTDVTYDYFSTTGKCGIRFPMDVPKIFGYKAYNSEGDERVIIVNLSDEKFKFNELSDGISASDFFHEQYFTDVSTNIVEEEINRVVDIISNGDVIAIQPHSVSLLTIPCQASVTALYAPQPLVDRATVSWGPVAGAHHYDVMWREEGGTWVGPLDTYSGTSRTIYNLAPQTTYEWKVRAQCSPGSSNSSEYSQTAMFTTLDELVCEVPTNLRYNVPSLTNSSVELRWSEPAEAIHNVSSYEYRYKKIGETSWSAPEPTDFLSGSLDGLEPVSEYQWQVRSVCNLPYHEYYSPFVHNGSEYFKTLCDVRFDNLSTEIIANSIIFNWEESPSSIEDINLFNKVIRYKELDSSSWLPAIGAAEGVTTKTISVNMETSVQYEWKIKGNCVHDITEENTWTPWVSAVFQVQNSESRLAQQSFPVTIATHASMGKIKLDVHNQVTQDTWVVVYDMLGKVVFEAEFSNREFAIDVSNYISGMYLVKVETVDWSVVEKVILGE